MSEFEPPSATDDQTEGGPYRPVPEDFIPTEPKTPGPLNRKLRPNSFLIALLFWGLCVAATIIYAATGYRDLLWVSGQSIFEYGEHHRLFSALFVHSGILHLLANTPLFLIFAMYLYSFFGVKAFPLTAFVIGALTNLGTVYFYPPGVRLIGASGMVYAMAGQWLVLYMRFDEDYAPLKRFGRVLAFTLIVMLPTSIEPTTSYLAHALGFLIGAAAGGLLPLMGWRPVSERPLH